MYSASIIKASSIRLFHVQFSHVQVITHCEFYCKFSSAESTDIYNGFSICIENIITR